MFSSGAPETFLGIREEGGNLEWGRGLVMNFFSDLLT